MKELNGIPVSPGVIIGKVFLFLDDNFTVPEYEITKGELKRECRRLKKAIDQSRAELEELKSSESKKNLKDQNELIDAQLMMLSDQEFLKMVKELLEKELINAEFALSKATATFASLLEATGNDYVIERILDLKDVMGRVMRNLLSLPRFDLTSLEEEVVLVGKNLLPSDTLSMNKQMVKGVALDMGGKTSHTAILVRSFGIPGVLGLGKISKKVKNGETIIVDGYSGKVILRPDEQTLASYQKQVEIRESKRLKLLDQVKLPSTTADGKSISVLANIEVSEEALSVSDSGADGIGLYRSEFLFMQPGTIFNEELQYESYRFVLETMKERPVIIRTLDIGGDKAIPFLQDEKEENPLLGWRSIRFCLSERDIFKRQLRALLRAGVYGSLKIMFPMISGVVELDAALLLLEEAKSELDREGLAYRKDIPIGIMIEVPSAALTSDILAKKVDFFSIGTNDLIQYTIAVDRGNERVSYLYQAFQPAVLRLIKMTIENAVANNISVSMCGEMAGDLLAIVPLLGFGLNSFSMSCSRIPEVKQLIRSVSIDEAKVLGEDILKMENYKQIEDYIRKWMNERFEFFSS